MPEEGHGRDRLEPHRRGQASEQRHTVVARRSYGHTATLHEPTRVPRNMIVHVNTHWQIGAFSLNVHKEVRPGSHLLEYLVHILILRCLKTFWLSGTFEKLEGFC